MIEQAGKTSRASRPVWHFGDHRYAQIALGILLSVLMLWPAIVNRGVFLFPDSSTYIRGADAAVYKVTGHASEWSNEFAARYEKRPAASSARVGPIPSADSPHALANSQPVVLAGRSIYYGALLYVADALGGFWVMAVFQAGLVATAMIVAARRIGGIHAVTSAPALLIVVPLLTSASFYAMMMMPDIFAPLAILAGAMIGAFWFAFSRSEKWFWSVLLVLALISHSANILNIAAMMAMILLYKLIMKSRRTRVIPLIALVGVAIAGEWLFSSVVDRMTGQPPVRPPFVLARLIDDGPAYHYLRDNCPTRTKFAVCRYVDRMPANSDAMLWSPDPRIGIFSTVSPQEQRRIVGEQNEILVAVVMERPGEVISSVARSTLRQLGHLGLMEFNGRHAEPAKLPPRVRSDYLRTEAANQKMPVAPFAIIGQVTALFSAFAIIAILSRRRTQVGWFGPRLHFVMLIMGGLLINVIVCGALSTPHDRYLTRMLWLIPFVAVALWSGRQGGHKNASRHVTWRDAER